MFNSNLKCSFVNSSFCTGSKDGSGSLSIWYNQIPSTVYYLNVISCYELACIEIFHSRKILTASKCNFVNRSKCNAAVNINCECELRECVFEDMPNKFNEQNRNVTMVNCSGDKEFEGYTFDKITSSVTLNFKVNIESCRYISSKKHCIHFHISDYFHCLHSLLISLFVSI